MSKTPAPFGHKDFDKNKVRFPADPARGETPCGYCGKACKEPWVDAVRVIDGGAKFASRGAPDDGPGEMGCWPVGPDCAKRLRKTGAPVFKWKDDAS